jgi:hypothetical protein
MGVLMKKHRRASLGNRLPQPQRTLRRRSIFALSLGIVAPIAWLARERSARAAPALVLVPIIGKQSPQRDISLGTLERVFLGRPVDGEDGKRFVPFNHPPKTRSRILFDQAVLGMTPDEVARHWVDQRIRGKGRPPRTVPSAALLKKVVQHFPGAIAYIPAAELDGSVQALKIGGVEHTSAQYPIRQ